MCGANAEDLEAAGIGMHVHHTRPFAQNGDRVEKISLCALCHEVATAHQRYHNRMLSRRPG